MYLLTTALLLITKWSLITSLEDYETDLSYGDDSPLQGSNQGWPQEVLPSTSHADPDEEPQKELSIDPRGGHPVQHFGTVDASEVPSWKFSEKEWALYHAGDPGNEDIPAEGTPQKILVAIPKDPSNKILLTLDAYNTTKVKLHYKFFIKRGEPSTFINPPDLKIFLNMNGSSMMLSMEKESNGWKEESLKFATGINEQVVFVAQLQSRLNEIALGDVWLENIGLSSAEQATKSHVQKKDGVVTSSYTNFGKEDSLSDVETVSIPSSIDTTKSLTSVSPGINFESEDHDETLEPATKMDETPDSQPGQPFYQDLETSSRQTLGEPDSPLDLPKNATASGNEYLNEVMIKEKSSAGVGSSLRIFLIISSICGILALVFVMWRRRRRRRCDDEVPVFNRSAEHHNPSFASDTEAEGPNYRSFQ